MKPTECGGGRLIVDLLQDIKPEQRTSLIAEFWSGVTGLFFMFKLARGDNIVLRIVLASSSSKDSAAAGIISFIFV